MDKAVKNVVLSLLISMAFILSSASVVFGDVKKAESATLNEDNWTVNSHSSSGSCLCSIGGISGSALELDGVNDYVSVPDSNSLDITDNITIEAWVYPYSMSWVAPLISKGTNSSNYGYYLATGQYYANGCGSFKLHSNGTKTLWLYSSQPLTTGQWNHVVGIRAGTSAIIENSGTKDATDVHWSIDPEGGLVIVGGHKEGTIPTYCSRRQFA